MEIGDFGYGDGRLRYEAAIDPQSAEVAELVRYYGPSNPNLVAAIAELPPEDAEKLAANLMGRIREVKGL